MKILAFAKYGDRAASTRQRLLQFRPYLHDQGIEFTVIPLLDNDYIKRLSEGRGPSLVHIAFSYLARFWTLIFKRDFDAIWVHYELFPYVFGFVERLAFISGKPVIYDFDDATFHQYDHHKHPLVRRFLAGKLEPLLSGAAACSCGNAYLKDYAEQFCSRCLTIPTVLNTKVFVPGSHTRLKDDKLTVGWIGSPSTWEYVVPLVPVLQQLSREFELRVRIVGAASNVSGSSCFEFVQWSKDAEVCEIQKMDIGIMPIPDEPWAQGKCGYKLIQYMACGLPVVASPVGVNCEIVTHGEEGYLATTDEEWFQSIRQLATDSELRENMGLAGRRKVSAQYSLEVQAPRLAELLKSVAD